MHILYKNNNKFYCISNMIGEDKVGFDCYKINPYRRSVLKYKYSSWKKLYDNLNENVRVELLKSKGYQ